MTVLKQHVAVSNEKGHTFHPVCDTAAERTRAKRRQHVFYKPLDQFELNAGTAECRALLATAFVTHADPQQSAGKRRRARRENQN